jgi:hydrogenase maturation protein HypF
MALEAVAAGEAAPYPFAISPQDDLIEINPAPLWRALRADLAAARPLPDMAAAFHSGLAEAFVSVAARAADEAGIGAVALSGGVLQNARLLEETAARLRSRGLTPLLPAEVPANDGGLALGQAVVAAARQMA